MLAAKAMETIPLLGREIDAISYFLGWETEVQHPEPRTK
jgi:hypothetical protein